VLAPLLNVTVPLGDPPPGAFTPSAKLKLVGWLMRLRVGPTTLIVVLAALTGCGVPTLLLAPNAELAGV